jgi:hypothetical protein
VSRIIADREQGPEQRAEDQNTETESGWMVPLTGALVVLTFALVWVGYLQRCTYEATLAATKVIERAYVDISHDPPGLNIGPDAMPAVSVGIKNHGRTPANVIAILLLLDIRNTPLPEEPNYEHPTALRFGGFPVMPGESVHLWQSFDVVVPPTDIGKIAAGALNVWVVGYVDYADRFGAKHRSGYCRRYRPDPHPTGAANNLVFENKASYNYDADLK